MKKKGLLKLTGIWVDNPEMIKIMKGISKNRKNIKLRDYTILK